jgi:hypothetical protein
MLEVVARWARGVFGRAVRGEAWGRDERGSVLPEGMQG